jgi:anti-sigma28 factor (negative regulator of flagellin synthesis)
MTDQHPGYREDWDITSEAGSLCFASAIYSRLVGGEQDEATFQWLAKYLRANAAPQHITIELRDRIEALEATQHAHIEAKSSEAAAVDRVLALQDQILDGTLTLAKALKEINGDDQPVQQFIAKYLFTDGNILQDSFCYDPSDSNSVSFDIAKFEPVNGCLKPGDGIKIAHRLGEVPASGVYSTINYKVASVSKVDDGVWTIRAVRVDTSDSEPAPTADDLDAVAAAGAQVGRSSAAVDRVLALQDQILDGTLTLAKALKEINGKPIERTRQTTYLVEKIRVRMIQEQKNSNSWQAVADAVLREVAEWLRSEYPQREGYGTAWANLLDNEANC